jgi:predicted ATPase with chaperone activity
MISPTYSSTRKIDQTLAILLIAAMNLCLCTNYNETQKPCTCTLAAVTEYQKRISVLVLDRIDMYIEAPRGDYEKPKSVNHRFAVVTASAVGFWADFRGKATKVATTNRSKIESVIY